MKRVYQNCSGFRILSFLVLASFISMSSCGKDDTILPNLDETMEEGTEDTTTDQPEDDSTVDSDMPTSGAVTFSPNLSLDESRSVLSYVIPESEYTKFIQGDGDLQLISQEVYEYLEDDFDFIIILSIETAQPPNLFFGRSTSVQNKVQGLGGNTFNNTAPYGSAERLKSIIYMPRSEYIRNGPFLHEIAHTWGNKGFIPSTVGGHWGYASTAGQLGGFDELIDLGNDTYRGRLNDRDGFGTFANGGNSIPYGNLELYLMGLIDANELEDVQVAVNPETGQSSGEFTADEILTYTAQSIIAENGSRLPSVTDAQKEFNAIAVIISANPLEQSKIDDIKADLENFSKQSAPDSTWGNTNNFWMATQGKASFDFTIKQETIK